MSDTTTIILINESKRAWSFPSRPVPTTEKHRLNERGRPKQVGLAELDRVEIYRPPLLRPGERLEVPGWYFEAIKGIKTLKAVWNRRIDGIAVGRTRAERAAAREAELETAARAEREAAAKAVAAAEQAAAREADAAKTAAARVAELERELAKLKAAAEKAAKPDDKPKG